jgi:hypothetical protein
VESIAVGGLADFADRKPNAAGIREFERVAVLIFATARDVSAEEPTVMGGW